MPGTASDLGINPAYYDSPYLQVEGGARYLARQLNTFDGNVINALAAYNAGPGRVFEYGGVPPFKETQHYVRVIPERYNLYLSRIGGIEALGTIDPALVANSNLSFAGFGAARYGNASPVAIRQAALRIQDIVLRIRGTTDVQDSMALNTYARAELVRLVAARSGAEYAALRARQFLGVQTMPVRSGLSQNNPIGPGGGSTGTGARMLAQLARLSRLGKR